MRRRFGRLQHIRWGAVVTAVLLLAPTAAVGQEAAEPAARPSPPVARPSHPKLDTALAGAALDSRPALTEAFDEPPSLKAIEVFAANGADPAGIAALMAEMGASEVRAVGDVVHGTIGSDRIADLASDERVRWIQSAARPVAEAVSEGVGATGADTWHTAGHTGAGVTIAVIDLGFAGWELQRDNGELPGWVQTQNYCSDFEAVTNHGTAVAEVAHDMAPDARLHLICIDTIPDLLAAVDYAAANGVTIINHSVGWFNTGRGDGSGLLEPVFEAAEAAGITWVNSAGNYAQNHWLGTFSDGDVDGYHDFDGDNELTFTLLSPTRLNVFLKWDDWDASPPHHDYDLELYREGEPAPIGGSWDSQTAGQPPTEEIIPFTALPAGTYHVKIAKFSATGTPEFDLFVLGPPLIDPVESERSLNDPSGSLLVLATGAAHWGTGIIEPYSSRGPNVDDVMKPDVTGLDGVSTGTYGFQAFGGTSAAAPHTAGFAALLKGTDRCQSRADLIAEVTAHTDEAGPDNDYGNGRIDLGAAPALGDSVLRYAGPTRIETAAAVSMKDFPCGARTVFVAVANDFPDALSGAAAAARSGAPVLLVHPDAIPPATAVELARLAPDDIVILGGTAVITDGVAAALGGYGSVTRLSGTNRYETSAVISQWAFPGGAVTAFVAAGTGFADALPGSSAAAHSGAPVLLTDPSNLPPEVATELQRLAPDRIYVLGGPVAVSDGVVLELSTIAPAFRLQGADRYATSAQASETIFPEGAARAYVAVGTNYPDALAGGGAAGFLDGPVLLVQTDAIPPVVEAELQRLGVKQIVVLGGTAVISAAVETALEALVS